MQHEKIFKRENGSRVKVSVSLAVDHSTIYWDAAAFVCEAGKRKFNYNSTKGAASDSEILSVKFEMWEKIKPFL